jgi:hypothetical protein
MPNYRSSSSSFTEELACQLLNKLDITTFRNNLIQIYDVDLKTTNGIKIDVQYSQNLQQYGDFRLDFISAYSKDRDKNLNLEKIFIDFENEFGFKVNKKGKIFQDEYLDALLILFYNQKFSYEKEPDYILIITKKQLLSYLNRYYFILKNRIKLNIKESLGDTHGSAFIPIDIKHLLKYSNCAFGNKSYILSIKQWIQFYLNNL